MQEIQYITKEGNGSIFWLAAEQFVELKGQDFRLSEMEAVRIETLTSISSVGKILLSAVAGAVIQHLIDQGVSGEIVFGGSFRVVDEEK